MYYFLLNNGLERIYMDLFVMFLAVFILFFLLLLELFPALELGNASWHRCKMT